MRLFAPRTLNDFSARADIARECLHRRGRGLPKPSKNADETRPEADLLACDRACGRIRRPGRRAGARSDDPRLGRLGGGAQAIGRRLQEGVRFQPDALSDASDTVRNRETLSSNLDGIEAVHRIRKGLRAEERMPAYQQFMALPDKQLSIDI